MKNRASWFVVGVLLMTAVVSRPAPAQDAKITVMNPRGIQPPIRLIPMPERVGIEGKTIYVVDTKYPNTKPFAKELHKILNERYPETNWVLKDKIGGYAQDDPALWKEIEAKAQGMIMTIGH